MKKIFALALCALLVMMCAAASADYAFATHHIGSTVHPYQKGAEFWNEKLQEYSGGTLSLDIYPANQLAAGSKAVEGNALGTIDICIENPMSVSNIVPAFDALNLPYMFDSAEQAFAMMKTEECKVFADECEKYNLKLLGYCAIQLPRLMAQFTPILKWPMGIIYIIMMVGLLLLTLYSFYLSLSALLRGDTKAQKKEKTAAEIAEEVE